MEKIRLNLKNKSCSDSTLVPVTKGVPLPKGAVYKNDSFILLDSDDGLLPVQFKPLSLWPDNSVKWMLFDFQASVKKDQATFVQLVHQSQDACSSESDVLQKGVDTGKITICQGDGEFVVNTNAAVFYLNTKFFKPFNKIVVDGSDYICGSSCVMTIEGSDSKLVPRINHAVVEELGEIKTVVRINGEFINNSVSVADFCARIHFFVNKSLVKIDFTLHNSHAAKHTGGLWDLGDPASLFMKDLSIFLMCGFKDEKEFLWRSEINIEKQVDSNIKDGDVISIYQDSSGGENWNSRSHVNRHNQLPVSFRGYQVKKNSEIINQGNRATPVMQLKSSNKSISCTIQHFWENFPKAMGLDKDCIRIGLFPKQYKDIHELQGGEKKTHTFYIDCSTTPDMFDWVHVPMIISDVSKRVKETGAVKYLNPGITTGNKHHDELILKKRLPENSFEKGSELIDEYGWRNFGEIYADHEAVQSEKPQSFISHYNNQYDMVQSFLIKYLETEDQYWLKLGDELAMHVSDIDIYHTDKDRHEYNGGLFWHTNHYLDAATCSHRSVSRKHKELLQIDYYGGGPGWEHNYSSGLLLHYYLTGNVNSMSAVVELADWIYKVLDLPDTFLGSLYKLKTKLPIYISVFKGEKVRANKYSLCRGTGNSIYSLLNAFQLTENRKYLKKAEHLIQNSIHFNDKISSRHLDDPEQTWFYTVLLQAIGNYLDIKCEYGENDKMFFYAKACLLHYARWVVDNEVPYLLSPEKLEYPNETWAAQDLRKSCILYYAAKYTENKINQKLFKEKGAYFYNYSVDYLNNCDTGILTRPFALLLQNSQIPVWFQNNETDYLFSNKFDNISDSAKHNDYLSTWLLVKAFCKKAVSLLLNFSLKEEVYWLKSRF